MFYSGSTLDDLAALLAVDVASLDSDAVDDANGCLRRVRGLLDTTEARVARRAAVLASAGEGAGARESMRKSARISAAEARRRAARAKTLEDAPELEDALGSGSIGSDHVDAATNAAKGLSDDDRDDFLGDGSELAAEAERLSPDEFREACKRRAAAYGDDDGEDDATAKRKQAHHRQWVDKVSGMTHYSGRMDPEMGAKFRKAIEDRTASIATRNGLPKNDHTAALALAEMVSLGRGADPANRGVPEVIGIMDEATAAGGLHDHSECRLADGTTVPPETMRRWMCDAYFTPVVLGVDGQPLHVGRTQRTANRAQRRALQAMYRGCAWEDCDRPFDWCEIHHIQFWELGGLTDLDNLIPLCSEHHHAVHEGKWLLSLDLDRRLTIQRPDRAVHATVELPSAKRSKKIDDERVMHQRLARERLVAACRKSSSRPRARSG